jgi:hypothetical protein
MKTIGIRTKPSEVTFAVYECEAENIINVEKIRIPKALTIPDALKYVRNNILDIIREYDIQRALLRITESNSKQCNIRRIEIEGVIQEAFASSDLKGYFCGQISSISSKIGIERVDFKKYVNNEKNFDRVNNWKDLDETEREAVLTALGAKYT